DASGDPVTYDLADPLRFLEEADPPDRPLPAIYSVCGTEDPIKEDTERLGEALARYGEQHGVEWYPGTHAFHAFIWQPAARKAWLDQLRFLEQHVPAE
ncbi:MAG: dienelactone hydrolase family protein, partial [Deltaproteobacteria bacterium]|nr:dienelactone hydrolase family protein [Deltaproteobacteria bacterium]